MSVDSADRLKVPRLTNYSVQQNYPIKDFLAIILQFLAFLVKCKNLPDYRA